MSIVRNIMRSYRHPNLVLGGVAVSDAPEARSLAYLMGGCALAFVAQWPVVARQAHIDGEEMNMLLAASLMGWLFIMPLIFYVLALLLTFALKALGTKASAQAMRSGVFWSFFAASPLMLLYGLVAGFIGEGSAKQVVGFLWFAAFVTFAFTAIKAVRKGAR